MVLCITIDYHVIARRPQDDVAISWYNEVIKMAE